MSVLLLHQTMAVLLLVLPILIIAFTSGLIRESSSLTIRGSLFVAPVITGAVLLFLPNLKIGGALLAAAQVFIIIGLLLLHIPFFEDKALAIKERGIYILSFLPLLLLLCPTYLQNHNWPTQGLVILGVLALMLSLLLPQLRQSDPRQYTVALALLLTGQLTLLPRYPWPNLPSLLLHGAAYLYFFIYFYHESVDHLRTKAVEAEGKLLEWERSIRREVNKRVYEIERSNSRLLDLAKTDAMTQVYNKVNIISIITALSEDRQQRPFSILMFDIDNFKNINDTRGHLAGDMVIKQAASTACSSVRGIDSVGRYGGDEFIIVLPNTVFSDAHFIAERLRKKVAENENMGCTISVGIATFPQDGETVRDLISAADEGLYLSKQRGRNAVSHRSSIL